MGVWSYFIRRVLYLFPVLVFISIVAFLLIRLPAGDPIKMIVNPRAGEQVRQAKRKALGLDKPLYMQYIMFLKRLVTGDLGKSIYTQENIAKLILARLPNTLILGVAAILISFLIAIPMGTLAAVNRGGFTDYMTMTLALIGLAMPQFWLGLLLILFFSVSLDWFPVGGYGTIQHLVLPTITLAAYYTALLTRFVRSHMLENLGKDYVRTARSKGLGERLVLFKHTLRNSLSPVISMFGLRIGYLIGGAVMIELIFNRPGIGRLLLRSAFRRDYPIVQVLIVLFGLSTVLANLLADILYAFADPQVRYD